MPKIFFSDNTSGTMADTLKAIGLAEVLSVIIERLNEVLGTHHDPNRVVIRDCGAYYQFELPVAIEASDLARITPFTTGYGQPFYKGGVEAPTMTRPTYPYELHKQARNDYFKQRAKLKPADQKRFDQRADEFSEVIVPNSDLPLYISINHFKAADAYNGLLEQWDAGDIEGFQHNLKMLIATFAQHPNDLAAAEKLWGSAANAGKATPTLLQVVNPTTGKGGNAPKATGLSVGNLSGFWLGEYLKFVGYFTVAVPILVKGSKDRKTYVLHPATVDLGVLRDLMQRFRDGFRANTSIKIDILAALRFARIFVQYREQLLSDQTQADPLKALLRRAPRVTDISTGFDLSFYKDMGAAYATMNQATINLPNWLRAAETVADAHQDGALLDEHMTVIRSIQTSKGDESSDEVELLRRYRDFLSGHDTERFFEFAAHFGDYYLARRHRGGQWVGQFTTEGMENLMAQGKDNEKLHPIIADEGFKAIAKAIRQATVLAQYHAAREQGSYPFDVRYGLGQDLLRASAYPNEFIAALSTFLQSYNAENARIAERVAKKSLPDLPRNRRFSVRTNHIDAIVNLVDGHGSEVVCKLLVAYGYARDPKVQQGEPSPEGPTEDDLENDGE